MGLITQADLEAAITTEELQRITDKLNVAINSTMVDTMIEMASSTVLKYAQGTPGYPWVTTPEQAKTCCIQITIYYIFKDYWGFVPPDRRSGFDESMDQLKSLAAGKTSWVEGFVPAEQNTATIFYTNSVDRPREGAPVRARRYFTDLL